MLVSEIAIRVKRQFGDEAGVQITDADIIRWVNDAQREIVANSNELMQTIATSSTILGQAEYTLPSDILVFRSVHLSNAKLKALNSREAEEYLSANVAKGTPSMFWLWAGKMTLYPTPDTAIVDALKVFYTRQPVPVTVVGDTPELPLEYHNRIVEYCLAQAYELDENWSAAQLKGQQFTEGVKALNDYDLPEDYYPFITSSIDDL